ncbi:tetratricopeptide repeat protein [Solwaraspora sp. WMMD406]|uniref:tetratricopeptide repeat protein n=1 Tax=Solwaraspora sp. WMMD406 TaxID=3016095 RepID=UPI00241668DA|nr:tetratricopeptide repeat protein [Solwaraspora sp. WMMD406]MDG4767635.1 tetratricopeptide repeat protein [Solwaraspora sp. WMMD406]
MSEGIHDPRLAAEGELALARLALEEGDYRHAADHVAGAITHAPTLPEVHELLTRLAARTSGGLELFPLDDHVFIGTVVARAHLLAAAGRPGEGLELLAAATSHAPGADWAGVPWVSAEELPGRLDPDQIAIVLMQICAGVPDPVPTGDRPPLLPYLRLADHATAAHPHHGLLLGASSALARRLGEIPTALDWATRGVRAEPTKLAEVWLGYAYRSAGRTADAITALRRASAHDPDDLSIYADIAGTLADAGRLDEAITWIEQALARNPTFGCAVHTAYRLRYQRDAALHHLIALADFQRDHPDDSHEHHDLAECCHDRPWLSRLPAAGGTVVATIERALTRGLVPTRLSLRHPEPPSAMRLLGTAFPGLPVTVERTPDPDPRVPRRTSVRQLWRYAGWQADPALDHPSPVACERIRQVAQPVWSHPPAAYDNAVVLATLDVDDLLGLLVHPPPPADPDLDPAGWLRCVQVWACLGMLHHRTDEAWALSTRRRVLVDVAWGVEDWAAEAAMFALVTAAWVDPEVRPDVSRVVAERLADAVEVAGYRSVPILWSLAQLALATPDLDPDTTATARRIVGRSARVPRQRRPGLIRRLLGRG